MSKFCQFKGATTSKNDFFEKNVFCSEFKIYIVNFFSIKYHNNHNIERFQQVYNYTTCLLPNVVIFLWMITILTTT